MRYTGEIIAYVRFKLTDKMHSTVKNVCEKLGLKESELSRVALISYLKDMGVLEDQIAGPVRRRRVKKTWPPKSKAIIKQDEVLRGGSEI